MPSPHDTSLSKSKIILIWAIRLVLGIVFISSGFSKLVDIWGTMFKITDYFMAWGIDFPGGRTALVISAFGLCLIEFLAGVCALTGMLRRVTNFVITAIMAVMLPLTIYIAIANPVADCGCFGDMIILSNTWTLVKNIVIVALLIPMWMYNTRVGGIYALAMEPLLVVLSFIFAVVIAFIGYSIQPIIDFRPYPIGSTLLTLDDDEASNRYIYQKDGLMQEFTADNLPTDTAWHFVETRADMSAELSRHFYVYDSQGDDVTDIVFASEGDQLILVVTDPDKHALARSTQANRLYQLALSDTTMATPDDVSPMLALVALPYDSLQNWSTTVGAKYPAYSVEDTALKAIVRGDAALIYTHNGIITYKNNLYSTPITYPVLNQTDTQHISQTLPKPYATSLPLIVIAIYVLLMIMPMIYKTGVMLAHLRK